MALPTLPLDFAFPQLSKNLLVKRKKSCLLGWCDAGPLKGCVHVYNIWLGEVFMN
jgi:hypothetical protein